MPKVKRCRSALVPTQTPYPTVRVQDYQLRLDYYMEGLRVRRQEIIAAFAACSELSAGQRRQCVNALMCGRILASQTDQYERTHYCQCRRICPVCSAIALQCKGTQLAHDETKNQNMRVRGFVFTLPKPQSYDESVQHAKLARAAFGPLKKAMTRWCRKGAEHRLGSYSLGLHTKASTDSRYLWSHVHLVMCIDRRCPVTGFGGIDKFMTDAWQHAVDLCPMPRVKAKPFGVLGFDALTAAERKKKKRGKICTYPHAVKLFAYAMRQTDKDDTPATIALRKQLLADADIDEDDTYDRSRSRTSDDFSPAHGFDPIALGKQNLIVCHDDEETYRRIKPEDYPAEHDRLLAWAQRETEISFPSSS